MPLTHVPLWVTGRGRYSYVSGRARFRLHLRCFVVALFPIRTRNVRVLRQTSPPRLFFNSVSWKLVVRLQVRSLTTVRQHEDAEEPGGTSSTEENVTPSSILASGLILYWRCVDGDELRLRSSGGCGRVGTLMGDTSWLEPLPTDEPLAAADEWRTAMALNCAEPWCR